MNGTFASPARVERRAVRPFEPAQLNQIAAKILARAPSERFDGKGYCFLETGGERAVRAEGSFFELPHPVMQKRSPDEAQFRDKLDWVARHLHPIR